MCSRGNVVFVAQQISFAKILAANDKKIRDKAIKKLKKYLTARSEGSVGFTEEDFMRIWKGLFYSMWMSDKPLIQEELAENISSFVHFFKETNPALNFIKTFFSTMNVEWFGIDQHRLDKFLMLVRRFLRQTLIYCQKRNWDTDLVSKLTKVFNTSVLSTSPNSDGKKPQLGLMLHFTDIFLEELAKVSKGTLPQEIMLEFLRPFLQHVSEQDDARSRSHVIRHIFHHLMKQSDQGIEFEEKFSAWKQAGFPGESCDDMKRVEFESGLEEEQEEVENEDTDVKDPRAGRVNVELPQLNFDANRISELVLDYAGKAPILKSRKLLYHLAKEFDEMSKGNYPLALKIKIPKGAMKKKQGRSKTSELWKAAQSLNLFEESLHKLDEEMDVAKGKKGKRKHEEDMVEDQVVPSKKIKRMELKLKRCDEPNGKIRNGAKKRKNKKAIDQNANINRETTQLHDSPTQYTVKFNGNSIIKNASVKKSKSPSPNQKTKVVLKTKVVSNGVEFKMPVKLQRKNMDTVSAGKLARRSLSLKRLRVSLNRWEVSEICSKQNQSPAAVYEPSATPVREKAADGAPAATPTGNKTVTQAGVKTMSADNAKASSLGEKAMTPLGTPANGKKVNIALQMNKEQKMSDYMMAVKQSPSIPFDAAKKPVQGVLKPCAIGSPINPFYRRSRRKVNYVFDSE